MPIYEYVCTDCGQDDERMVPFSKADDQDCNNCKGHLFRKVSIPGYVWSPSKSRKSE